MVKLRRIALLMHRDLSFCRDVIRGVRAYALRKPDWVIRNGPPEMKMIPALREWRPDGVIAELFDARFARRLSRLRRPIVDTAFWLPKLKIPVVDVDHAAVGQMAAEYLMSLGLTRFAFFGSAGAEYSRIRQHSFERRLAAAGHAAVACQGEYLRQTPTTASWKKTEVQTRRWLLRLAKPVGVFVCNDILARSLADLCGRLQLHVPEDVAILGVDNDEMECLLTAPPLSSIAIPGERIGYEAAKLLDQSMKRGKATPHQLLFPPVRVVARQSTDTLAIHEQVVTAALRHLKTHAAERINVPGVARAVGVGRRELERKFRGILGRSVLQELRRLRIAHAQKLLTDTDLPMPAIARLSGFSSAHRLAIVFHRQCGLPPTAYRRRSQIYDL